MGFLFSDEMKSLGNVWNFNRLQNNLEILEI